MRVKIALASYNRCLFICGFMNFFYVTQPLRTYQKYLTSTSFFSIILVLFIFLFNGRSVLCYCSQPLEGDIDASTFSLGCILHLNVTVDLKKIIVFYCF